MPLCHDAKSHVVSHVCVFLQPPFPGMLPVLLLAGLILALSIPGTASESATLRFLGQTEFVVNESSTAVVRLVVERVGDPVNVTALVLVRHRKSLLVLTHAPHKYSLGRMQKWTGFRFRFSLKTRKVVKEISV